MEKLTQQKCVPCRGGVPTLTDEQIAELLPQIPEWRLVESDGIKQIERVFKTKDFAEALAFTNQVGALAEDENHHPAILTEWGKVTVTLWAHAIKGLHRNDFIMAAKINKIFT
ncbi:MAG: 4a-hydroxytetrahydrobiopterin dehydratase [Anaerolineales bacterium]|jgi:4a-hydroxytetrahydrobiopterin dehydratase